MEQKKLTELSLDELWQLFPITLTAHQDYWTDWYKEEAELLKERLPCIERISHYKDLLNGYFIYTYVMREIMMNCISEIIFKQIQLLRKNMNGLNLIYGNNMNMTEICTLPTKVIS